MDRRVVESNGGLSENVLDEKRQSKKGKNSLERGVCHIGGLEVAVGSGQSTA